MSGQQTSILIGFSFAIVLLNKGAHFFKISQQSWGIGVIRATIILAALLLLGQPLASREEFFFLFAGILGCDHIWARFFYRAD